MAVDPINVGGAPLAIPPRPSNFGTPPGSLSVADFVAWSVADQADYVQLNGTGTPPTVRIGPSGSQQIFATVPTGGYAVDIVYVPQNFDATPASLTAAEFLDWNTDQQLAYLRTRGGSATIGNGGLQITATASGSNVGLVFIAPPTVPTALTPTEFLSWNDGFQLAYVKANGTGTPKSVLIGLAAGEKALARLDLSGTSITAQNLPADFNKSPASLDANVFLKWTSDDQLAYVQANGGGPITVGAANASQVTAAISGNTVALSGFTAATTAPGSLAIDTFLSWDTRFQTAYITAKGTGNPKTIEIGNTSNPKILTYLTSPTTVEVLYPPAEFYTARTSLSAITFLSFSPRLQVAYVRLNGIQPVTIGASGAPQVQATVVADANGKLSVSPVYKAPTTSPTSLDPQTFLSWPDGFRKDYVTQQGTGTPKSVTIGATGTTDRKMTVSFDAAGTALVYDEYWTSQAARPADPVLDATTTQPPIPYFYLPGSDVGITSVLNNQTAEDLFPTYDGVIEKLPNPPPAPKSGAYTADEFLSMHSAHQLEILKDAANYPAPSKVASRTTITLSDGTSRTVVTIGSGDDSITIVQGTAPDELFVVNQLQKQAFATMSKLDQEAVAKTSAFQALAGTFGLTVSRSDITVLISAAIDEIKLTSGFYERHPPGATSGPVFIKAGFSDPPALTDNPDGPNGYNLMTGEILKIFMDEIANISLRVNNYMAVFSQPDIANLLNDLKTRFNRIEAFGNVKPEGHPSEGDPGRSLEWTNVCSLDGGATIKSGFDKFVEQEKRLLSLDNARLAIANTGITQNKKLDAPNLVFLLQLYYNLGNEAVITANTEEVNQTNVLLKTYSEMQRLINLTKEQFGDDPKQKKGFLGRSGKIEDNPLDLQSAKVASMFEDYLAGGGYLTLHPIEKIKGIPRPGGNEIFSNNKDHPEYAEQLGQWWDKMATMLSDTVTLINQDSQIKMNDINSMDKEKNRHFDLANSALQKMNEIITSVARVGM